MVGVLGEAVGNLLPSALAVALSPIPIVAVVLVLGGPRAPTAGPAFAGGWIAGLVSVSVIVVLLVGSDPDDDDPGVNSLKLAIGIAFLLMAGKKWTKRPRPGEEPKTPGWMATIDSATTARGALLGAALSGSEPEEPGAHPRGGRDVAEAGLDSTDAAIAVAVLSIAADSSRPPGLASTRASKCRTKR
jgi:hypothetical protein